MNTGVIINKNPPIKASAGPMIALPFTKSTMILLVVKSLYNYFLFFINPSGKQ
jgi:hypothetical protein